MILLGLVYGIIEGIRHVRKERVLCFFLFSSVALAFYSYNIVPIADMDLLRHFEMLEKMKEWTVLDLVRYVTFKEQPLSLMYFFLFSKVSNQGLMTAITTFLVYFAPLLLMYTVMQRDHCLTKSSIESTLAIFMCTYMFTMVTGIRQALGIALSMYGVYFNYIKKKNNILVAYILYISACFMHASQFALLILIIISELIYRRRRTEKIVLLLVLSWSLYTPAFQYLLTPLRDITFFKMISSYISIYVNINRIRLPSLMLHIGLLSMPTIVYLYCSRNNIFSQSEGFNQKFISLFRIVLCFTWGSILVYDVFLRFTQLILTWSVVVMPYYFSSKANVFKERIRAYLKFGTMMALTYYTLFSYIVLFY